MKRWDGMVEGYLKTCEQRGLSEDTRYMIQRECERLGCWLKRRRPKVILEEVSGEMLVEYVKKSTQFNARATGVRRSQYQQHVAMAVLALLHGTGLRRGELERLDLEDWMREEGVLVIDGRKTGRERAVPVSEGMWRCVEAYLPRRHNLLEKVGRPVRFGVRDQRTRERLFSSSGIAAEGLASTPRKQPPKSDQRLAVVD
jgi:site-specific recombinase XerD